jgi:hypothetical protein
MKSPSPGYEEDKGSTRTNDFIGIIFKVIHCAFYVVCISSSCLDVDSYRYL